MIHILVLEDDAKLNQIVCTYLHDCGFEAKGCLNAREACDEMYNSLYDLIISDIIMPEIDGFEFAWTVRRVNKHIPILFMSAREELPAKQKGFQMGIWALMIIWSSPSSWMSYSSGRGPCFAGPTLRWTGRSPWAIWFWMRTP